MGLLSGKVCLVTGAASNPGLGHAIAHCFGAEGATVIATDVDLDGANATAESINAAGGSATAWRQDVTDPEGWQATMGRIRDDHGRIDTLVNNAGIAVLKKLEDITLEDYNRQMVFRYAIRRRNDERNWHEGIYY